MPDREIKERIVKMRYGMEIGYGQEIIRCKNCRHGEPVKNEAGEDCIQCNNDDLWLDGNVNFPDWFCADGEQK